MTCGSSNGSLVANSNLLTLAGALTTLGAFGVTFTFTGTTGVTFPTSGTLATTASIPSLPLTVPNGGTGDSSLTAYAVLCGGTTSTAAVQSIASVGTAGQVLTSNGAAALPTFQTASGGVTGPGSSTNNGIATWNGTGGTALFSRASPIVSSGGVMTNVNQPCFSGYLSSSLTNATGDGTRVTLIFDTATVNQGTPYNTGTGVFTAPVTGNYLFTVSIFYSTFAAGTAYALITAPAGDYYCAFQGTGAASSGALLCGGSVVVALTATQTVTFTALASGGAKVVNVGGQSLAAGAITFGSATLLC